MNDQIADILQDLGASLSDLIEIVEELAGPGEDRTLEIRNTVHYARRRIQDIRTPREP